MSVSIIGVLRVNIDVRTHIFDPDKVLARSTKMSGSSECYSRLLQRKCSDRVGIRRHDPVGLVTSNEDARAVLDVRERDHGVWQPR